MAKKRVPGFGEGFQSTFAPTANEVMMTTLKQLMAQPQINQEMALREQQYRHAQGAEARAAAEAPFDLKYKQARAQDAMNSLGNPTDTTRVTLTPEIVGSLPQLKGLGLEGKTVPAAQMLDIRKVGKGGLSPDEELASISRLMNLDDVKFGTSGVAEALRPRRDQLINQLYKVKVVPVSAKKSPPKKVEPSAIDSLKTKFGFGQKKG